MISRRSVIFVLLLVLCLGWQGCSHHALDEAQRVVAEADSLWHEGKMYGIDAGDSLSLAQAYETLGKYSAYYAFVHRTSLLATYAHACYHYGRLLREKDDPVAAMQVFISATHTHTDDLHILGRIYSNMGSLCHLAGDYPLAYDMYERSGDMYLQNGDTLNYYVAKELEINGFYQMAQYDSVLSVIEFLHARDYVNAYTLIMKARTYDQLNQPDSAISWARKAVSWLKTENSYDLDINDVLDVHDTIMGSDYALSVGKDLNVVSDYVSLLKQDLNHKPDLRWLYAILATLLLIGSIGGIYIRRKRKQHKLLSQRIESKESEFSEWQANKINQIEQACAALRASDDLQKDLHWKDYDKMCAIVNGQFYLLANKLKQKGTLNETEIRLCVLVMLDFSRAEIAHTLPYALNSIGKLKDHTAKSLGTTGKNLRTFLLQMIVGG